MRYTVFLLILCQTLWATPEFLSAAKQQVGVTKYYVPQYQSIAYPQGDISGEMGVCTDVIIRGLRALGVDLQKWIHEDMTKNFKFYPQNWGLSKPDPNIDHRRVPNMATFFQRTGMEVKERVPYKAGDILVWGLGGRIWHIGVISDQVDPATNQYKVIHNICCGV